MAKSKILIDLQNFPEIKEKIANKNASEIDELVKTAFESYLETEIKNQEPETEVDGYLKVLNNLVEWANKENNDMEVK